MENIKVAITGIGSVTACGVGSDLLWESVLHGQSEVKKLSALDVIGLPIKIGAEASAFKADDFIDVKACRRLDRSAQMALAAAELAVDDARLNIDKINNNRCGVYDGSSLSSLGMVLDQYQGFLLGEKNRGGPSMLVCGMTGNSSAAISMKYKFHGPAVTLSHGSVSSACAIGWGMRSIKSGDLDLVIAGGTEAPIHRAVLTPFSRAGVLSRNNNNPSEACRPFASNRDGFALGEGAVYLVLENYERAVKRGAKIYCLLNGFEESSDAWHPTSPDPQAQMMINSIRTAIDKSDIINSEIGYINMHGTATKANDIAEARAVSTCFGSLSKQPWCGSTKPITGHLLGGAGAVEAAITIMSLSKQIIPPQINSHPLDDECEINLAPQKASQSDLKAALTLNASFGGRNSVLLFERENK